MAKKPLTFSLLVLVSLGAIWLLYSVSVRAINQTPIFSRTETVRPNPIVKRPEVQAFIGEMVAEYDFDSETLNHWFAQIGRRDDIIAKITRPAEKTKPWYAYRKIFLDAQRIRGGATFWHRHQNALLDAEQRYGVTPETIVAILGVETRYGRITGRDGVLEALATLAFDYPRRAKFFRQELEHYLLLTREEGIDPLSLRGSYAGAMGLAQFMPSSYRNYAVDFDRDGQRDLWQNPLDAIGSIGNYLARHGWQRAETIIVPAQIEGDKFRELLDRDLKPKRTVSELRSYGVIPTVSIADDERAILLQMETEQGLRYWLGLNNFYVITRYNHSSLYAMAVYDLSQEIKRRVVTR